jgi:hypothetical protein
VTVADPAKLGAKLGPRVAQLTANAVIATKQKLAPHQRSIAGLILHDWFDLVSSEQAATIGEAAQKLADADELPPWARKMFRFTAKGKGQWATLANFAVYGTGLGNSLFGWLTNELAPATSKLIAADPNAYHSPAEAAQFLARRMMELNDARYEAARGGIDATRFDRLTLASYQFPSLDQMLQLVNRGKATRNMLDFALQKNAVYPDWAAALPELAHQLLDPSSLADMVVRGIIEEAPAAAEAEQQGYSTDRFAKLVLQSGEPPAIEQLLFLYRRGLIDQSRLVHGIRQSRVRNEWIDAIEALQFQPLSPGDAIAAHVQGHMDEATSRRKWAEGGLLPEDWQPAFETAGEPIAIGQALDLYNRGQMTLAEVTQAIRESRIKNKYIPFIEQLHVYLPPVRTIVALLRQNAITRDRALTLFAENGVRAQDAIAYADEAQAARSSTHREFTASQVQEFYRDGAIVKADANDMLIALGYDQEDVDLILLNAEFQQTKRARDQAINRVHSSYVGHKIDRGTASADLSGLHVSDTMIAQLLDLWDDELNANVRVLTEAQVITAIKKGSLSSAEGLQYLMFLGYGEGDGRILINNAGLPQP